MSNVNAVAAKTTLANLPRLGTVTFNNSILPWGGNVVILTNTIAVDGFEVRFNVVCNANTPEEGRMYAVTLYKHYTWKAEYYTIN